MSKKPDFTQKLLDDLRLRKQRLAAAHQKPSDARDNLRRPYQGAGDANNYKTTGYKPSHGRHRSLPIQEASKELVPVQASRIPSEYITHLSMALMFALENGGRLGNIELLRSPMARNKAPMNHAQRRSVDLGGMNSKYMPQMNNQLVTSTSNISHLHITEISRGAHKLNQILRACSHGLNFDTYSIEVGRELLKGAVNLEESLRMLVNLQEASQYMVSPQRKQRIQLIEADEDDETTFEEKVHQFPEKPRFSFDGSSRNSIATGREITKTNLLVQKLPNLPYSNSKAHQPNTDNHAIVTPNSVPHRRLTSFDPDYESISTFFRSSKRGLHSNTTSNPLNSTAPMIPTNSSAPSNSKNRNMVKLSSPHGRPEREKTRIPNVIAKLMGLEEIPLKMDLKNKVAEKIPGSRQGTRMDEDRKEKTQRSLKRVDAMTSNSEKLVSKISRQMKEMQVNKIAPTWDNNIVTVNQRKGNQKVVKNMENTIPIPMISERSTFEFSLQMNTPHMDRIKGSEKAKQEAQGREDNTKPKERRSTVKGDHTLSITRKPVFAIDFGEKPVEYQEALESQKAGMDKSILKKEYKNAKDGIFTLGDQQEPLYNSEHRWPSGVQKSDSKEAKHARAVEKNAKIKSQQVTDAKKTNMMSKNPLKPVQNVNPQKKMLQKNQTIVAAKKSETETANVKENVSSTCIDSNMRKSAAGRWEEQTLVVQKIDAEKAAAQILQVDTAKIMHAPSGQKEDIEQVEARESKIPSEIKDTKNKRTGSPQTTAQRTKQTTSVLQELKQRRHERIIKVSEPIIDIQPATFKEHLQQKDSPASNSCDHFGDYCRTPKQREKNSRCMKGESPELLLPDISLGGHQALKSDFKPTQSRGPANDMTTCISSCLGEQLRPNTMRERQGSLTMHETHLKEILVKSQHFLNAAETLFGLQIPFGILHASQNRHQDKDNQLVLDCAYEIMKRKGEREERSFHPYVGMPIVSMKVKSLDDLVKALHEDLENLEFHGDTGGDNLDAAAKFLHQLLEGDIRNRKPHVNCVWDFGWNDMMFAYPQKDEVVKDVEKHVLNRLVDEITGDLLHVSIERNKYKSVS